MLFVGAAHTWNEKALTQGADPALNGQPLPSRANVQADGSSAIAFDIAPLYRGAAVRPGEGGTITITVRVQDWANTGTLLTNLVCGSTTNDLGLFQPPCANATVLVQNPDLTVSKTASPGAPASGD